MVLNKLLSGVSNLMCIWYHDEHISVDVLRHIKICLHKYFRYSQIFDNIGDLATYLADKLVIKRVVFISNVHDKNEATAAERLVHYQCGPLRGLYRLQLQHHVPPTRSTIEKDFDRISEDLRSTESPVSREENTVEDVENAMNESSPLFDTFKSISTQSSLYDLNKESLQFLLVQSLIEVLIRKPYDSDDFVRMWNCCYQEYIENPQQAKKIEKVADNYEREKAIYYYTQCSCLFRLVNRAFRLENVENICRFGCYLADVHQQLERLADIQRISQNQNTKTFYRGKRFSTEVIQQFKDNIGHLISLKGFLSTSEDHIISEIFSGLDGNNGDYQSVIFEININCATKTLTRPYANISKISEKPDENEVLFFMGFVWKLKSMKEKSANAWYIVLDSCTDYNPQLIQYIEESRQKCTHMTIGNILRELGDDANANNFYKRMLKDENLSNETRGHLYFNMAMLADDRGAYLEALDHLREAEQLIKPTPTIHDSEALTSPRGLFVHNIAPSRVHIFNNMGRIYLKDGEYQSAKGCFEAALQEPSSEIERATVLNNYGLLEFQCRKKKQAYDYIYQAVQLARNDACSSEFKRNLDIVSKHLQNT